MQTSHLIYLPERGAPMWKLDHERLASKDLANQQTHDGLAMHGQVGTITINPSALGWIKNLQSMPLLTQEGFQHKQT